MKTKLSLKNIIIIASSSIVFFILIFFIVLSILNKKPVAAFYGIPENTRAGIVSVLQTTHTRKNKKSLPYEIVVLDNSLSLHNSMKKNKKADILFINKGLNSEYASSISEKRKTGFEPSVLNGMTTSIKNITPVNKNKVTGVPILIDNYEIDVNINSFKNSRIHSVNFWSNLEKLAQKTKASNISPVLFAANDDETIINIFGALVEALSGPAQWRSLVDKIRQCDVNSTSYFTTYTAVTKPMIKEGGELFEVVSLLRRWQESGLIPKNIDQIGFKDVNAYMSANLTTINFMTLSQHRTIEYKVISQFSSIYYPYTKTDVKRHFTSPVILAVPLTKNKIARNSVLQMADSLQASLSAQTGLAPTMANCSVPDRQADDVRFWVAASEAPFPALSDAAFTTKKEKSAFADVLRNIMKQ